jgi:hypothetical protein
VIVLYRGKRYLVLALSYLGDERLYKLKSRHPDGAPFGALKTDCKKARS